MKLRSNSPILRQMQRRSKRIAEKEQLRLKAQNYNKTEEASSENEKTTVKLQTPFEKTLNNAVDLFSSKNLRGSDLLFGLQSKNNTSTIAGDIFGFGAKDKNKNENWFGIPFDMM